MTEAVDPGIISGYHAHLYYAPETRPVAERLRAAIGENFPQARIGSWHDEPVGPHPVAMYQVAFAIEEFPRLVPWLMLNREGSMFSCTPSRMTASRITRNLRFGSGRLFHCASRCCGEGRGRVDPAEPGPGGSLYSTEGEQNDNDNEQ